MVVNISLIGNLLVSLQDRPAQAIYQPRPRSRANAEEPTARNAGTV